MCQLPALCLLLLLLIMMMMLARNATSVSLRSDDVIVQHLTVGEQLTTIAVVPRPPQTTTPALQHLNIHTRCHRNQDI